MQHPYKTFGRLGNSLFQYATLYALARKNNTDFYFQDPKWFQGFEEEIKEMFGEGIGYLDQVSIHVRVGNNPYNPQEPRYDKNPFYVKLLETDYYQKAIALFPDKNFLVFSDDPEYVKTLDMFKGKNFQIMDMKDEVEDFNLASSCSDHIIANSSFSYWYAYVSPNLGKKIVAPRAWYSDGVERTVCPSSWIRI